MPISPKEVEALAVLKEFCDDIDATGGVLTNDDGECAPAGDEEWIDLASTYLKACKILNRNPKEDKETL